jgi:hypothetical protein
MRAETFFRRELKNVRQRLCFDRANDRCEDRAARASGNRL